MLDSLILARQCPIKSLGKSGPGMDVVNVDVMNSVDIKVTLSGCSLYSSLSVVSPPVTHKTSIPFMLPKNAGSRHSWLAHGYRCQGLTVANIDSVALVSPRVTTYRHATTN